MPRGSSGLTHMFEGRNILVTGGAGFIGSHLVEKLVKLGASVTSADHQPISGLGNLHAVLDRVAMVDVDLATGDLGPLISNGGFEFVFHLAGSAHVQSSVENPLRDFARNALSTLRLLDAIRIGSPRTALIYTSSAVVYHGGGSELIKEDDPTHPRSPYGVSKLTSDRYTSVFAHVYGLRTAVARLFTVYGPRLRKQIIWDIVGRLRKNGEVLPMLGDGAQMRDFSYVGDVIEALLLIASKAPLAGEAYNVASGSIVTVDDIARLIARTMQLSPTLDYSGDGYTGDTTHWFADTARLRALGYEPQTPLEQGIEKTVDWILKETPAFE